MTEAAKTSFTGTFGPVLVHKQRFDFVSSEQRGLPSETNTKLARTVTGPHDRNMDLNTFST